MRVSASRYLSTWPSSQRMMLAAHSGSIRTSLSSVTTLPSESLYSRSAISISVSCRQGIKRLAQLVVVLIPDHATLAHALPRRRLECRALLVRRIPPDVAALEHDCPVVLPQARLGVRGDADRF